MYPLWPLFPQGVACADVPAANDASASGLAFTCGTCPDGYSGNGWACTPCPLNVSIPYASFSGATVAAAAPITLFGKACRRFPRPTP